MPRPTMVTERSTDTDYDIASVVGSQEPLGMKETADSIIMINDYVLAYTVGHIYQRPRKQEKMFVLSHFTVLNFSPKTCPVGSL